MKSDVMFIELVGEVSIYLGIGLQVITALVLGGLVGLDREKKLKSAGIKTNILICLGATLYSTFGLLIASQAGAGADPNRMAAQIVSGIGFLGAGAIIQGRGNVRGMTTAATIWVVAAIGYTIGSGYPLSAIFFTLTVLLVLKLLNPIYSLLERRLDSDYFVIEVLTRGSIRRIVRGIILKSDLEIDEMIEEDVDPKKGKKIISIYIHAHRRHIERLVLELGGALKVEKVAYHLAVDQKTIVERNMEASLKAVNNR